MLDDLFSTVEKTPEPASRRTIPFDYIAVAEELHSGRIKVSADAVAAEYRLASEDIESELKTLLSDFVADHAINQGGAGAASAEISIDMLSLEPEAIATELGLDRTVPADLGRLRRLFALKNHPDRVPLHLRERALQRMQIANGLIDAAKQRALAKARG
ncbi:MAG: hypothetical protein KF810_03145 [Rhizobiaceae bacterium]|nr:hypothetical protein [Rhizobiaceae bacterium]